MVKKNQPQLVPHSLQEDVQNGGGGASPLRASTGLNDYLDWPYVQQVFQVERRCGRQDSYAMGHNQSGNRPATSAGNRSEPLEPKMACITGVTRPCGKTGVALGTRALFLGWAARSQQRAPATPLVCARRALKLITSVSEHMCLLRAMYAAASLASSQVGEIFGKGAASRWRRPYPGARLGVQEFLGDSQITGIF